MSLTFAVSLVAMLSLCSCSAAQQLTGYRLPVKQRPGQLYNTPSAPPTVTPAAPPKVPPATLPAIPPKRKQPEQLYQQAQRGDATRGTGSLLFPDIAHRRPDPLPPATQASGMEGMPYNFKWEVREVDPENRNNLYDHEQQSDGMVTSGSYRVLLPDGRLQIVEFVDRGKGYEATVRYEQYTGQF